LLERTIYRIVNFHRPRVYRDEKRVGHDVLNDIIAYEYYRLPTVVA
jgi:hypothetical protein